MEVIIKSSTKCSPGPVPESPRNTTDYDDGDSPCSTVVKTFICYGAPSTYSHGRRTRRNVNSAYLSYSNCAAKKQEQKFNIKKLTKQAGEAPYHESKPHGSHKCEGVPARVFCITLFSKFRFQHNVARRPYIKSAGLVLLFLFIRLLSGDADGDLTTTYLMG